VVKSRVNSPSAQHSRRALLFGSAGKASLISFEFTDERGNLFSGQACGNRQTRYVYARTRWEHLRDSSLYMSLFCGANQLVDTYPACQHQTADWKEQGDQNIVRRRFAIRKFPAQTKACGRK
jgi:hypothetical protein